MTGWTGIEPKRQGIDPGVNKIGKIINFIIPPILSSL